MNTLIHWSEPVIEQAVRDKLAKPEGSITVEEAESIDEIRINYRGLKNISDLGFLKNLTTLCLSENEISDISVLSRLTKLKELDLDHNKIRDISALGGLRNLTRLNLDGNKIKDFSPIVNLPLWKNPGA